MKKDILPAAALILAVSVVSPSGVALAQDARPEGLDGGFPDRNVALLTDPEATASTLLADDEVPRGESPPVAASLLIALILSSLGLVAISRRNGERGNSEDR